MSHMSEKLVALVRAGKVVVKRQTLSEILLVPLGKYIGAWVMFSHASTLTGRNCHCNGPDGRGEKSLWDLESWIHVRNERNGLINEKGRELFDAWKKSGVRKLEKEFSGHLQVLAAKTGLDYRLLTLLFMMTGTKLFAAYYEHPQRFVGNFQGLSWFMARRIMTLSPQLRWELIISCYKMPWRHVMRRMWPRSSPQVLNALKWENILRHSDARVIRWAHEDGPLAHHKTWSSNKTLLSKTMSKPAFFRYLRNYGAVGATSLTNYLLELRRAQAVGLPLPAWPNDIPPPSEADRRHAEIARLFDLRNARDSSGHAELHRRNWARFTVPDGWRPLITQEDFVLEGNRMHHCVAGYVSQTGHFFAHLNYKDEQGTIECGLNMFGRNADHYQILQLRRECNDPPSEEFMQWATSCLKKMAEDARKKSENPPPPAAVVGMAV